MSHLKAIPAILLIVCLFTPCVADVHHSTLPVDVDALATKPKQPKKAAVSSPAKPATTTKAAGIVKPATATKTLGVAKGAPAKAAPAKAAQRLPRKPLRTEAEISGLTSETSDQIHGRLSFSNTTPRRQWWIKTGYGFTTSRTYGRTKIQETDVSTFNLDTEFRQKGQNSYRFISAVANLRNRSPHTSSYFDKSGYHMISAGYGRTILHGVDCEIALAHITQQRGSVDRRVTPVYTLRMRSPLSSSMTLDCDTHLVQPWAEDSLVDSRANLTYKLTPALSMRLTYVANNILGTALTRSSEWDKSFRISLVFGN